MKNTLWVAVSAAAIAAGCAGPQASTGESAAASAARGASLYCIKDRLIDSGGNLECNWQPSAADACRFRNATTLARGTVAGEPQTTTRCNTGEWLVKVTPR